MTPKMEGKKLKEMAIRKKFKGEIKE